MLYVLNHDIRFFANRNVTKFCRNIHCRNIAIVIYPLCFKKQTLGLSLYSSFKVELPTSSLQNISFLVFKSIQTWKNCCEVIGSYLGVKLPQFYPQRGNFLLHRYSKVIDFEFRISSCQSKVHEFFWWCNGVLILPKLHH